MTYEWVICFVERMLLSLIQGDNINETISSHKYLQKCVKKVITDFQASQQNKLTQLYWFTLSQVN